MGAKEGAWEDASESTLQLYLIIVLLLYIFFPYEDLACLAELALSYILQPLVLDIAVHIYNILVGQLVKLEEVGLVEQVVAVLLALALKWLEELAALVGPFRVAKGEEEGVL